MDAKQVLRELVDLREGIVCVKAIGGYKFRPQGMNDAELNDKAAATLTDIYQHHVCLRAAEQVLKDWGKEAEYRMKASELDAEVAALADKNQKKGGNG